MMKKRCFYFLLVFLSLPAFNHARTTAGVSEKTFYIKIENPSDKDRTDVPFVIKTSDLKTSFPVNSVTLYDGEREIPSQTDDLDHDRKGDEIAFVIDMNASSQKTLRMVASSEKERSGRYPARVYADLLISDKKGNHVPIRSVYTPTGNIYNQLHHHGPAFESESVAYRIYFDKKQTVDIYGKFNKGFEIEASGWYPDDEQLAKGFGDDVLRVSGSCGVGALKAWNGKKALHIELVEERGTEILAYGPVRTIVDMVSNGWQYNGKTLDMTCRYTLYAGHRDAEVEVIFAEPLGNEYFCTGVQNIKGSVSYSDHTGLVGCWGTDFPVNDTIKYGKETVGLAVSLPSALVKSEINDNANYLYQIAAPGQRSFKYHITFTSLKETFGYKTPDAWFAHIRDWKKQLDTPCRLTIKKK